ncbi:MAG: endonuclease/exonuclease/phosphatase family protein, partial [Nitrosopumilus sp.]|nr:endonuclease/exonuclease/phosphatase family protein [Nitrosopumilus sp.]
MSNDVDLNPGPRYGDNFFTFLNWNLNSLAKNEFERVNLLEAHNSVYNYDLISLCETCLTDSVDIPNPLMKEYTFISAIHPSNSARGGVGLFYKDTLPLTPRHDLSFSECIVVELKFGRKKIFFSVLYRSPSIKASTPEFTEFMANFKHLHEKNSAENPYASFYTGDFNGHSQFWWKDGDTTSEGKEIDGLFTSLNLTQIISEPTNFQPGKNPSCIDLIATDQPNLILDSGTRPSLDTKCHHQIIHCKVNFRIPPPPPIERTMWHYDKADTRLIQKSMKSFPWQKHLSLNTNPNWQVKTFRDTLLNIMSNFVPHTKKICIPRDPPWISKSLKTMLKRKNRLYKNYKKNGYKLDDKDRLDILRNDCHEAVEF